MKSITKSNLTHEQINRIARQAFDENCVSFTELGDGWFNTAYDIELDSGRSAILKIAPPPHIKVMRYEEDIMAVEVDAMQQVKARTSVPVPDIYTYNTSYDILGQEYYMMEKLKGVPYNYIQNTLPEEQRERIETCLGRYNRQINEILGDRFGLYASAHPRFDTWYEAFYHMVNMMLEDGAEFDVDITRPYDELLALIASLKGVLDGVAQPRLTHWDLWAGNVFVDGGRITGIIDFERALWGDPMMEVFFYLDDSLYFINGYGEDALQDPGTRIRRRLYGLYMGLAMVIEIPYRQYEEKGHKEWVMENLKNRFRELEEVL